MAGGAPPLRRYGRTGRGSAIAAVVCGSSDEGGARRRCGRSRTSSRPTPPLDAAKHLANQAALANADSNIQLHGGIGVTDEHHAHLLLKHALLLSRLFGGKRSLLTRLLHAELED